MNLTMQFLWIKFGLFGKMYRRRKGYAYLLMTIQYDKVTVILYISLKTIKSLAMIGAKIVDES